MRTVVVRVAALAMLLLLALVTALSVRTLNRLPDSVVHFVRDEGGSFRLQAVGRRSNGNTTEARLRTALQELIEGPSQSEVARGLSSSFPAGVEVRRLLIDARHVEVDLSAEFALGGGSAQMRARLNQLFYTLTQPSEIDSAALYIEGQPVRVFSGEGLLVARPWRREAHPKDPVW